MTRKARNNHSETQSLATQRVSILCVDVGSVRCGDSESQYFMCSRRLSQKWRLRESVFYVLRSAQSDVGTQRVSIVWCVDVGSVRCGDSESQYCMCWRRLSQMWRLRESVFYVLTSAQLDMATQSVSILYVDVGSVRASEDFCTKRNVIIWLSEVGLLVAMYYGYDLRVFSSASYRLIRCTWDEKRNQARTIKILWY